eukprot:scaffold125265_cov69-Phaeocystis_antarctica.AAC.2
MRQKGLGKRVRSPTSQSPSSRRYAMPPPRSSEASSSAPSPLRNSKGALLSEAAAVATARYRGGTGATSGVLLRLRTTAGGC